MPTLTDTQKTLVDTLSSADASQREALKEAIKVRAGEIGDEPTEEELAELVELGNAADTLVDVELVATGARGHGAVQAMARKRKTTPSPDVPSSTGEGLVACLGTAVGKAVTDRYELGQLVGDQAWNQVSQNLLGHKVVVASAKWSYPPERQLGGDAHENARKLEAVCHPNSLVATGGICAPVNVDYSVPTWATAERRIRDGLPSFEATRGGILFVQPPDIAEWEAATGIWTEATDAEPAGQTKPVKVLACGQEEKVFVQAVGTRVGFGNMQSRFAPEQVAANMDLAIAAAARVAEESLLNLIEGFSVKKLETAQHLGYGRDLISAVSYAVAAYRNIHRVPETQMFTAIIPSWVKEIVRADLAREQAHDNAGPMNVWEVSDAQIDAFFGSRKCRVIWHLDGQKEPASKNYKTQYWGTPAEGKKLDELLPNEVLPWYLFPEGAVQFLDAGRLDLGVVRDSTLDATNDYETFVETFETVANRGFSKGVWQILSSLKATGASSGTITPPVAP